MRGAVVSGLVLTAVSYTRAGNTECRTDSLDWYTQSVGESPCRMYERLRQMCNSQYELGSLAMHSPGDQCTDQVSDCCCNSVAFALSMLCQNCQYGVGSSLQGDHGFDAPAKAYDEYLHGCPKPTNKSLPIVAQKTACNAGLDIPSYLYTIFWVDGAWFYEYTKENALIQMASGTNITKFCTNNVATKTSSIMTPGTSAFVTSTTTPKAEDNSSSTNAGAIAGGIIAGVALVVIAALVFWFSRRRHSRRDSINLGEDRQFNMAFTPYVPPTAQPPPVLISPAQPTSYGTTSYGPTSNGPSGSSGYTYTNAYSNAVSSSAYTSQPQPQPRPAKAGAVARSPPTQEEIRPTMIGSVSLTNSSGRHEDSAEFSAIYVIGRSASGRLPPTYQER